MITASKLDLVRHCLGSQALPQRDSKNEYQEAGNERDAEFTRRINAGDIPEALAARWPGATWRTQVAFAYNWDADTGRELPPSSAHRDYSDVGVMEICGTADAVGRLGDLVIVVDFKSFDPNVPRAQVNSQLHIAALAFARAYELKFADVAIHHEARAFDVASLDDWDLAAFAQIAKRIVVESFAVRARHRDGAPLQLAAGYWCRWCAAFDGCPKQKELTAMVVSGQLAVHVETQIPLEDDKAAADLYDSWKLVGILYKRMSESLHARAAERPIPLNNGRLFAKRVTEGSRTLDGDKAYQLIRTKYGQEVADKAVSREATQTGIEAALKERGEKSVDAKVKAIVAELEKIGGVTRKPGSKFEEVAPERLAAAAPRALKAG